MIQRISANNRNNIDYWDLYFSFIYFILFLPFLRYPAEVVSVDTSGKRFQRMCMARKSVIGCPTVNQQSNNKHSNHPQQSTDEIQTISRRSRSRKSRGKRRNTIAGTDQKEIQDAANR